MNFCEIAKVIVNVLQCTGDKLFLYCGFELLPSLFPSTFSFFQFFFSFFSHLIIYGSMLRVLLDLKFSHFSYII